MSKFSNVKDLTGQKINNLLVIKQYGRTKYKQVKWLCQCDCGEQTVVVSNNLLNGNTESCGCKRKINQRKGIAWETLIKEFLGYKYDNLLYHEYLPNKTIPDFMTCDKKIIFEAKRNDYLQIDECIKKYGPYCEKLVFICMEKKRNNWKVDFEKNMKIEFWYPNDILNWIPKDQQMNFLQKVKNIENLWIKIKNDKKKLQLQNVINNLEKEEKNITRNNIAEKLGLDKKIVKNDIIIKTNIENYDKESKSRRNEELAKKVQESIAYIIEKNERLSFQNITRRLIQKYYTNEPFRSNTMDKQLLWRKTKILSTNNEIKELINVKINEREHQMKEEIIKIVNILKSEKEKVTILDIRKRTQFTKNYLYSKEIKQLIQDTIEKYDKNNNTVNQYFKCKISFEEVETTITNLKANKVNLSKKEIQRQLHCDHKAINNDQKIKDFIEKEIVVQEQNKIKLIRETIEEFKTKNRELSIQAIALETGLSKKFIRKKENLELINTEVTKDIDAKKQKIIKTILDLKQENKKITLKLIQDQAGVSRKFLAKNEIRYLIERRLS